jgi:hypothetical protein
MVKSVHLYTFLFALLLNDLLSDYKTARKPFLLFEPLYGYVGITDVGKVR